MSVEEYFTKPLEIEPEQQPPILFKRPELLMHPNIPKPLHGLAPRTLMGNLWWDTKRREAYAKNNYHCFACGSYAPFDEVRKVFATELKLHAHESYKYDYENCSLELEEIVALCPICHDGIHSGRMNAMYDKGVLDEEDCWVICSQKENVLSSIDKESKEYYDTSRYIEDWGKWHLVLDGKKFYSKFKSYEEWKEHYK